MREKTPFQVKCSRLLIDKIQEFGMSFNLLNFIDGDEESYFLGELGEIKVWIYEDGACIKIKDKTYIFEEPDYKDLDDLIRNLIKKFIEILEGHLYGESG